MGIIENLEKDWIQRPIFLYHPLKVLTELESYKILEVQKVLSWNETIKIIEVKNPGMFDSSISSNCKMFVDPVIYHCRGLLLYTQVDNPS